MSVLENTSGKVFKMVESWFVLMSHSIAFPHGGSGLGKALARFQLESDRHKKTASKAAFLSLTGG